MEFESFKCENGINIEARSLGDELSSVRIFSNEIDIKFSLSHEDLQLLGEMFICVGYNGRKNYMGE